MASNLLPWIVAGAALAAAAAFFFRLRAQAAVADANRLSAEKLQAELISTRSQLEKSESKQRRSAEERIELRRKLDKIKKRGASGDAASAPVRSGGRASTPPRLAELENELERARQARDAAREEVDGMAAELKRLRTLAAAPAPAPGVPEPVDDSAAVAALEEKISAANERARTLASQLAGEQANVKRLRAKLETQEILYVSIRSELDAKKDRLRTQQEEIERMRALKAGLVVAAAKADARAESSES